MSPNRNMLRSHSRANMFLYEVYVEHEKLESLITTTTTTKTAYVFQFDFFYIDADCIFELISSVCNTRCLFYILEVFMYINIHEYVIFDCDTNKCPSHSSTSPSSIQNTNR